MTILDRARVVVTGGAGFIGSHLVDALLASHRPREVVVLDNLVSGRAENLSQWEGDNRFRLVVGDIRDQQVVSETIADAEVVFHLACLGVRHSLHAPLENHSVNATGTLVVALAAMEANVRRFVHVSSSEVFGTAQRVPMDERHPTWPETVYGGGKLAGEAYARAMYRTHGMPAVIVRPFNTYGPRSHFEGDRGEIIPRTIVKMLNGEQPVVYGEGTQTRDFMHVTDTAAGLMALARCDAAIGETVNIGTGKETTMLDLCAILAEATGRPDLTPRHLEARPGDVRRLCADSRYMKELTGFEPAVDLRSGIGDLVHWFRHSAGDASTLAAQVADQNWVQNGVPL